MTARLRIPDTIGAVALLAALTAGLWTLLGPGQDGPITARPGMLWVGALSSFGCLILVLGNFLVRDSGDIVTHHIDGASPTDNFSSASLRDRVQEKNLSAAGTFERAGLSIRPIEYGVVSVFAIAALSGLALLILGAFPAILLAAVGAVIATVAPRFVAARRTARFNAQLPDALMVIASGMRAGQSLSRSLDMLASSSDSPMSDELNRALVEARVGRLLVDALDDVARRTRSETFGWVAQAIQTNRQLGGNLSEILENAAETIRVREKINKKVRAVSAEGRMSAIVLVSLPILLALAIWQLNPDYLNPLWTTFNGRIMSIASVVLLTTGSLWIRRIVDVEY